MKMTTATVAAVCLGCLIAPVVGFQISTVRRHATQSHKGAVGRWRKAVHEFWAGKNIYRHYDETDDDVGRVRLHPNTPFTVMLLTPFAYLSVPAMALTFNVLKVAALPKKLAPCPLKKLNSTVRSYTWLHLT